MHELKPDAAEQAAERIDRDKAIIFGELAEPRIDAIARIIREVYAPLEQENARLKADLSVIDEYLPGHFGEPPSKTIPVLEQQARELAIMLKPLADLDIRHMGSLPDNRTLLIIQDTSIKLGDIRKARAVLAKWGKSWR